MNLYDELELPTHCTTDEIKQKYRTLAQTHHPDKGGDEEKFKRIKTAYEILSDPTRRAEYDLTGKYDQDVPIKSEAYSRLSNMVSHYTQQINPEIDDLILKMKVDIYQAQETNRKEIDLCLRAIEKFKIVSRKLKLKHEGENILKTFVDALQKQKEDNLIFLKRTTLIFDLMLNILEEYQYGDLTLLLENQ
jgi:curved DNA-binding protein CbpA